MSQKYYLSGHIILVQSKHISESNCFWDMVIKTTGHSSRHKSPVIQRILETHWVKRSQIAFFIAWLVGDKSITVECEFANRLTLCRASQMCLATKGPLCVPCQCIDKCYPMGGSICSGFRLQISWTTNFPSQQAGVSNWKTAEMEERKLENWGKKKHTI